MSIDLVRKTTGRPSKLTNIVRDALVNSVSQGNYISVSCRAAGISVNTYENWLQSAKLVNQFYVDNNIICDDYNDDELCNMLPVGLSHKYSYWSLFQDLKTAEARAIESLQEMIVSAARKGPQYWMAAMTLLERRHPDMYGKRDALDVNVSEGRERLEQYMRLIHKAQTTVVCDTVIPDNHK